MLKANNVSKSYYSDQGVLLCRALDKVSLSIDKGDCVVVTGPSGSGKSTLLNLLGGIDSPDSGEVSFDAEPLGQMDGKRLAEYRNRCAGFIFQDHYLIRHCTVLENVLLPCLAGKKRTTSEERERAESILEHLGIIDRKESLPSMLSGGERQRAAFARSLINAPDFILADEPTGNLDQKNSMQAMDLLLSYAGKDKKSVIVVTHSRQVSELFETEYELIDGRMEKGRGPA